MNSKITTPKRCPIFVRAALFFMIPTTENASATKAETRNVMLSNTNWVMHHLTPFCAVFLLRALVVGLVYTPPCSFFLRVIT